jgi:hypothetical protein
MLPPGSDATVYPVIGEPPSLVGGCHSIFAWASPAVATTSRGLLGRPSGVAGELESDGPDCPATLVAVTVKV